jgi:hypothetical protein
MLIAHIVPGYFAAVESRPRWRPEWSAWQRILLWMVAFGSTIAPDLDVVYNALLRGFINHSVLWTHSLFVHLGVLLTCWLLRRTGRWPYLQMLIWLTAIGGLSHLFLDAISHGTPLLYPVSAAMFGISPARIVKGGLWAYLTDPVFLLEPCLLGLSMMHWIRHRVRNRQAQKASLIVLTIGLGIFVASFLLLLPALRDAIAESGLTTQ